MSEPREKLLQEIKNELILSGYCPEDINDIANIVTRKMENYEVQDRCTDLQVVDNSSEKILKLYCGTLLTEGKSKATVRAYSRMLRRFQRDVEKPFVEVGTYDVRLFLAKEQQRTSLRSCENVRSYLSSFYHWLTVEEFIDKDPMAKIKPIKYEDEIRKAFTDCEIDAMKEACTTLRERAEIEMLLSTGARVSELSALNITDIDFRTYEVIIREGKGGKQRTTYMSSVCAMHLVRYLESRTDDKPFVFLSREMDRLSVASIERDLKKIGKRANVTNVHPHRCRRTFATNLVKKGMDIRTVQILMGHSNIATTMEYVSLSNDHVKSEYKRYA